MAERPGTTLKGAVNCTPDQLAHFISSLDPAGVSYPTSSSATGPCAPSKSTRTASGCSCNARPTGASPGSPSSQMSPPLTAIPGAESSMSSVQGSPVNRGAWPASGQENRMRVTCGLIPTACFARYDPATHCLRTSQASLFTPICDEYSQTLPPHGMMRSGQCWELATWVLPTAGNASGYSWPTPNAQGGTGYMSGSNRDTWRPTLEGAAQMAPEGPPPAITADEYRGKGRKAAQLWPTPNVPNGGRTTWHAEQEGNSFYHEGKKVQLVLEQAVRLATPTSRDWRSGKASPETMARNARPLSEQVGGQLNPTWVCWLMGWPLDWEALGPLSPQTCRAWQQAFRTALTAYVPSGMGGRPYVRQ
jgi:hypothetical protein